MVEWVTGGLKPGDFKDQQSEGLVEARCSPPEGRETGDSGVQGSEMRGGRGRSGHASAFGSLPVPSHRTEPAG